jgi:hypothetical protein
MPSRNSEPAISYLLNGPVYVVRLFPGSVSCPRQVGQLGEERVRWKGEGFAKVRAEVESELGVGERMVGRERGARHGDERLIGCGICRPRGHQQVDENISRKLRQAVHDESAQVIGSLDPPILLQLIPHDSVQPYVSSCQQSPTQLTSGSS